MSVLPLIRTGRTSCDLRSSPEEVLPPHPMWTCVLKQSSIGFLEAQPLTSNSFCDDEKLEFFSCAQKSEALKTAKKKKHECHYLFVTIICGCYILRFRKNRKNFFQHIRHSGVSKTALCFPPRLWNMHNHSLLSVSAFSFLPSRAVASSRKSMIVGVSQAKLTGAHCTMWHVSRIFAMTTCIYIAATSVETLPHLLSQWISTLKPFTFGCVNHKI